MMKSLYNELLRICKEGEGEARMLRLLTDDAKPVWIAWLARIAKAGPQGDITLSSYTDDVPCEGGIIGVTPFAALTNDGSVSLVPNGNGAPKTSFPEKEPFRFSVVAELRVVVHDYTAYVEVNTPVGHRADNVPVRKDAAAGTCRLPVHWPDGCGINGDLLLKGTQTADITFRTVPRYPYKTAFSAVQGSPEAVDLLVRTGMMDLWMFADTDDEKLTAAVVAAIKADKERQWTV